MSEALTLVFLVLALIPIYTLSEDIRLTTRLGSAGFILALVFQMIINRDPDPEIWTPKITWTIYMGTGVAYIALHAVNVWVASLGILQIGALLALLSPARIFSNFVRELGRNKRD